MNGNPASGEICARAFDVLLQAIMCSGHYQRLQPPVPQTALSAALRETSPQHPIPH